MFLLALAIAATTQSVPTPAQTPVALVVSGRTSTLKSIVVQNVGQTIPDTFSGARLRNAANFNWFVSRHYALQTDYPEKRATLLLTLLELAYPHYAELFGKEPAGLDEKRMAIVYGSSKEALKTVLDADRIAWNFGGGGITFEGIRAAFNYPSGTLQYHQRYIMLHECTHLFQICLYGTTRNTPEWFYEGIADAFAHHVWNSAERRLTVNVVDKPTVNNWYDAAFEEYAKNPFKASDILSGRRGGRDLGFLLVTYFDTDLSRRCRFRIWRDELIRLNLVNSFQEASDRLIGELFGAAKLDAGFDAWIHAHHSSFHYVDWGWEQDGDAMVSYGYPQHGPYAQTNLNFLPKDKAVYDPLVMDYPLEPQSDLVGKVSRGGDEPTVGCLVDFHETPNSGVAGLGLGVQGTSMLKVLVDRHARLIVDATDLGGSQQTLEFPNSFLRAMGTSYRVGLTVKILEDGLVVTARTGEAGSIQQARVSMTLANTALTRLLTSPMAVISREGRHWITPYVDDGRLPETDLSVPAPANRWRFAKMPALSALFRAGWRLGDDAPASITQAETALIAEANGSVASEIPTSRVIEDIRHSHASPDNIQAAIADLAGGRA